MEKQSIHENGKETTRLQGSPLTEAWPRVELVRRPTPVERVAAIGHPYECDVWVKHDDVSGVLYGGNKVRKLEFLLADARARGCTALVTAGAYGSHQVLATTLYGAQAGFAVWAALVPQPASAHAAATYQATLSEGCRVFRTSRAGLPWAFARALFEARRSGYRPYAIGPGASSALATLGYVDAGFELAAQIHASASAIPAPRAVYVALGSGGTAAGLAIGLAASRLGTEVVAVRVASRALVPRFLVHALIRRTVHMIRRRAPRFPEVSAHAIRSLRWEDSALGPGYGHATLHAERAIEFARKKAGLVLEPTYTGKAFSVLLEDASRHRYGLGPVLFWATASSVQPTAQAMNEALRLKDAARL